MDRQTIYFGQVPLETDLLRAQQNAMVALAKISAGVLGATTIVNGFACTPTTPATLSVLLTAGEIYQLENLEASAWSSQPANVANTILKQGILLNPATLGVTPPGTVGYSQVYLVEVQYQDLDSGAIVLPYYNAASPSNPFAGPGNSGTAQNTARQGIVAYQLKAGIAAPTGTQAAPTADAGWTGLFTITVANGQTTITSGNISQLATAPFIPVTLPQVPAGVQSGKWVYGGLTTNSGNAFSATLQPAPTSLTQGMVIYLQMNAAPLAAATTLNVNGLGASAVVRRGGLATIGNDWLPNDMLSFEWTGAAWMACSFLASDLVTGSTLSANATWYVNGTTGSDTLFDGTSATVSGTHGPFATIQRAVTQQAKFNMNGFNQFINVADYATGYASVVLTATNGAGTVFLTGNTANLQNVPVAGGSSVAIYQTGGNWVVDGFRVSSSGLDGIACVGGKMVIRNLRFGSCARAMISLNTSLAQIQLDNQTLTIESAANCQSFVMAAAASNLNMISAAAPPTLNILGAMTFSVGFITASYAAIVQLIFASVINYGNGNGTKFSIIENAMVSSFGNGISYYPGTIAGTQATGGQYS